MPNDISPERLSAAFDLFPLRDPRVEQTFEASTRNDNYLVRDADGRRYVLRRYRRNTDRARVEFQVRFQRRLFDAGFPVQPIVDSTHGGPVAFSLDEPWALFGFVEGEHYDFDRSQQAEEAGRRLAEFHLLTQPFDAIDRPHELKWEARSHWTEGEADLTRLHQRFDGQAVDDQVRYVRSWLDDLRSALPLPELDALPGGWLHDDYHGRNTIFTGDRIAALLDFDKLVRGAYVLDIQRGLFTFGRERRGSNTLRLPAAGAFLAGYNSTRPLLAEERSALPTLSGIDSAPFAAIYGMLEREGVDLVAALRADVENLQRGRERAAAILDLVSH